MVVVSLGNNEPQLLNNEFLVMNLSRKLLILILILIGREQKSKIFKKFKKFTLLNYRKHI